MVREAVVGILLVVVGCVPAPVRPAGPPGSACPLGTGGPPPAPEDAPVASPAKRAWERAHGGKTAARPYVRARLRGWPQRMLVPPATLPSSDEAFLRRLAADTWRGLDAFSDRARGLPVDHVHLGGGTRGARDDWEVGDYTNVSTIGLYLAAIVAASDLALVDQATASTRIAGVLATVEGLETRHGHLFNYYDTTSGERTSSFLSFVDAGWLTAGLMMVRSAFPALAARATRLITRTDFAFFYDPAADAVRHGYDTRREVPSRYHYGMLYTEARLPILLAIGKGDVPESAWYSMVRTYPPTCLGQPLPPRGVRTTTMRGYQVRVGHYEWRGVRFVPSWGGSMFEALMPLLFLDELRVAPHSLGANALAHALVQRRYATEVLGYPLWGMSPSTRPGGRGYGEYGVPVLGAHGYPAGAVTPHAVALALAAAPDAARMTLRRLASAYPLYGDFGLYDAVDPVDGRVARTYLTLDQAMILIALANHLHDGIEQRRFEADPIVRRVLPLLAAETFFDDAPRRRDAM